MIWRNGPDRFGLGSRLLHWGMAALVVTLLGLGLFIARMEPALSTLWLYGLHKGLGAMALALVLLRLVWHRLTPPPPPLPDPARPWGTTLAVWVHRAIYLALVAVPLTGWLASSATGIDILLFDTLPLPAIAPPSPALEDWGFAAHRWLTRVLLALLALHLGGAALRASKRDGTLARMITGHAPKRAP